MHVVRTAVVTVMVASTLLGSAVPGNADPGSTSNTTAQSDGNTSSVRVISKREVESIETSTRRVTGILIDDVERRAGNSAAGGPGARPASASVLPGCFNHIASAKDGTMTVGHICPGRGGLDGAAAELFGLDEIVVRDPDTGQIIDVIPVSAATGDTTTAVTIDSATLAQLALASLSLPQPHVGLNPAGDHLVQLPSWLWIDPEQWEPRTATASAGGVSATVTATPVRSIWDMGNGDTVTCDGPGRVYQPRYADRPGATDCKYRWRHSSAAQPGLAYDVTTSIGWAVDWTGTDGNAGDFGEQTSATSQPVRVAESQALIQ